MTGKTRLHRTLREVLSLMRLEQIDNCYAAVHAVIHAVRRESLA